MRSLAFSVAVALLGSALGGQAPQPRPPVIDMHVHSTTTSPQAAARLESLNVRYWFLAGLDADLRDWASVDACRYLPLGTTQRYMHLSPAAIEAAIRIL